MSVNIRLEVDNRINVKGLTNAVQSDKLWKYAATEWHRLYKDWVPMQTGELYRNVVFRPKEIEHISPYAHYLYEGKMYGPNIPISENGTITGFFSPMNRPKSPTWQEPEIPARPASEGMRQMGPGGGADTAAEAGASHAAVCGFREVVRHEKQA